jgi:putative addiction module CopG family antidote
MNVDLPLSAHFIQFIHEQLESGRFRNESDLILAALKALEDQSRVIPSARTSRRSPRGLLSDIPSHIGPDDIKQARADMWACFPRGPA